MSILSEFLTTLGVQDDFYIQLIRLDFIGNTPADSPDQSDTAHPAGFPIMTDINAKVRLRFITRQKRAKKRSLHGSK
ncbi:MAG: hypothetical protein BECKG1743F_GA0114225_101695 [Candidatus Kentron sp. G]|nr:MAG: hypothetical protein BECKG1743F_GA0114225_101695 [Candidatus Kentron sp. G]